MSIRKNFSCLISIPWLKKALLITIYLLLILVPYTFADKTLTLSTSVNSPFGDFSLLQANQLKFNPTSVSCVGLTGVLYLSSITGRIEMCNGGVAQNFQPWTQSGDTVSLTDPLAKIVNNGTYLGLDKGLTVNGGSIVQADSSVSATDIMILGRGRSGFIWNPSTGSLAAGQNGLVAGSLNTAAGLSVRFGGDNTIDAASAGSSILGGSVNAITGNGLAVIGGGQYNNISADFAAILGGQSNTVSGTAGVIGGGRNNQVTDPDAGVFSGNNNQATRTYAFVGGGDQNRAQGQNSMIGGGGSNTAEVAALWGTIGGGNMNTAKGRTNAIGGGYFNTADGRSTTIGGGEFNAAGTATNDYAVVAGGHVNLATGWASVVSGGESNEASGDYSVALGGNNAKTQASGSLVFGQNLLIDSAGTNSILLGNHAFGYTLSTPNVLVTEGLSVGIGIPAPTSPLAVKGSIKQGSNGQYYMPSISSMNVIIHRARVNAAGVVVTSDAGVASVNIGPGVYRITYPNLTNPIITVTAVGAAGMIATVNNIAATECLVYTFNTITNLSVNNEFTIIVTGNLPAGS